MFNSARFPLSSSGRSQLSSHISGRNSALSVMEIPPVVPPVVPVPISTTHNPVLSSTPSTSTMNEPLRLEDINEGQSLYSRIRSYLHDSESSFVGPGFSDSQSLALRALQSSDVLEKMQLCYRFFPDHMSWINATFSVTKKMKKRLKQICKSIDFFSSSIPLYVPDVFQHSNLGQGMRSLVHDNYDKIVVEAVTFYKGKYGRVIILASLGVCCTVWSIYVPGLSDVAPPMENFPRFESYQEFFNPETTKELFSKACYIERTDISGEVIKTLEKEFPFNEMHIPAIGDKKIAIGLALMIVVFMALGVAPVKQQI